MENIFAYPVIAVMVEIGLFSRILLHNSNPGKMDIEKDQLKMFLFKDCQCLFRYLGGPHFIAGIEEGYYYVEMSPVRWQTNAVPTG
ncbi:hypothetical protein ACFL6L_05060, partial [candidate division KSB1 bacterium]